MPVFSDTEIRARLSAATDLEDETGLPGAVETAIVNLKRFDAALAQR